MKEPELLSAVELVQHLSSREFNAKVEAGEVEDLLREVLFAPRHLWRATQSGLVTRSETANALASHVYRWLMDRSGRPWGQQVPSGWEALIRDLEAALFSPK